LTNGDRVFSKHPLMTYCPVIHYYLFRKSRE